MGLKIKETVEQEPAEGLRTEGRVKWFDPVKGFGFVVPDTDIGTADALLHISVLRSFGAENAAEGMRIECYVAKKDRGLQVTEIVSLEAGETEPAPDGGPMEDVTIKWFNRTKGYGFVQKMDDKEDIFLHMVVLRKAGLEEVEPGQKMIASIAKGPKGRHVAEIRMP